MLDHITLIPSTFLGTIIDPNQEALKTPISEDENKQRIMTLLEQEIKENGVKIDKKTKVALSRALGSYLDEKVCGEKYPNLRLNLWHLMLTKNFKLFAFKTDGELKEEITRHIRLFSKDPINPQYYDLQTAFKAFKEKKANEEKKQGKQLADTQKSQTVYAFSDEQSEFYQNYFFPL